MSNNSGGRARSRPLLYMCCVCVCSNRISATGAEALCMLLLRQPLLVELDLEANRITQEGARALGLALQHNKSLRLYVRTQPGA